MTSEQNSPNFDDAYLPQSADRGIGVHIEGTLQALPPKLVTPGRWWFRWMHTDNIERIRRVVVIDLSGRLHMHFADAAWRPCSDSADLPVDLLGNDCGFFDAREMGDAADA